MDIKRLNVFIVASVMALAAAFVAINYKLNVYGLFGDVRGRPYNLPGGNMERLGKYLFSFNYIPSNFDGLLIGSSISDNWDTSVLQCGRIYNASINGGNISEEALIAQNVLRRRRLNAVLFIVYPYLTETDGPKSAYMTPHEYWAALGSIQLLKFYATKWGPRSRRAEMEFSPYGQFRFEVPRQSGAAAVAPIADFPVNEDAFAEYAALVEHARRNSATLKGIVPLVTKASREVLGPAYDRYNSRVRTLFRPGEEIIDLNLLPELSSVAADAGNFPDGHHYSLAAAAKITEVLARLLGGCSANSKLRPEHLSRLR